MLKIYFDSKNRVSMLYCFGITAILIFTPAANLYWQVDHPVYASICLFLAFTGIASIACAQWISKED